MDTVAAAVGVPPLADAEPTADGVRAVIEREVAAGDPDRETIKWCNRLVEGFEDGE
jgi:hypothetical protein